jgi:hypothetical protein
LEYLRKDPLESTNLADQNPDVVQNLTAKLDAWWNPLKN